MDVLRAAGTKEQRILGGSLKSFDRKPWQVLLLVALLYLVFHAFRPALLTISSSDLVPTGLVGYFAGSFPSFLLGVAITASFALVPTIRFRSHKQRVLLLSAAIIFSAIWFEAFLPRWVPSSVGNISDSMAMLLGAWLSIWLFNSYNLRSAEAQEESRREFVINPQEPTRKSVA